jgi:hypothetical protein
MRMHVSTALVVALVTSIASGAGASTATSLSPPSPVREGPCETEGQVVAKLAEFFDAMNSGDDAKLTSALRSEFYARSTISFTTRTRGDAIHRVRTQHAAGDRFAFRSAQVNALNGWDGAAHFGPLDVVLTRDGFRTVLTGKGAVYCNGVRRGLKVLGLAAVPSAQFKSHN